VEGLLGNDSRPRDQEESIQCVRKQLSQRFGVEYVTHNMCKVRRSPVLSVVWFEWQHGESWTQEKWQTSSVREWYFVLDTWTKQRTNRRYGEGKVGRAAMGTRLQTWCLGGVGSSPRRTLFAVCVENLGRTQSRWAHSTRHWWECGIKSRTIFA
jgi:hypothetical protein